MSVQVNIGFPPANAPEIFVPLPLASVAATAIAPTVGSSDPGPIRRFPGAEGYGAAELNPARMAGASIQLVKNQNNSGTNSLRGGYEATGPRLIIFNVSGNITLNSALGTPEDDSSRDDYWIVGQSAQSPGISLLSGMGGPNDVLMNSERKGIISHIRLRPTTLTGNNGDPSQLRPSGVTWVHVSSCWAGDELFDIINGAGADFTTIMECLGAEALFPSGRGTLIGSQGRDVALIRNLQLHCFRRVPAQTVAQSEVTIVNCMGYNQGGDETENALLVGGSPASPKPGGTKCNFVKNTMKDGPDSPASGNYKMTLDGPIGATSWFYHTGNSSKFYVNNRDVPNWNVSTTTPAFAMPATLTELAEAAVQAHMELYAGARPLDRDSLDTAWIAEMVAGTGSNVSTPGTPPSLSNNPFDWETHGEWPSDPFGTSNPPWTNIERFIYEKMTLSVQLPPIGI